MKIVVMKFGGTSVANVKKIRKVAETVINEVKKNKVLLISFNLILMKQMNLELII